MIRRITIENFKSIQKLDLELGRVNVLIGENGCGKTNILEAIAFAGAASWNKVDRQDLAQLGIRVTEPRFVRSAFAGVQPDAPTHINAQGDDRVGFEVDLWGKEDDPQQPWWIVEALPTDASLLQELKELRKEFGAAPPEDKERERALTTKSGNIKRDQWGAVRWFVIYAPENSVLRFFQTETQVRSLGVRGEGLFAHLKALGERNVGTHFSEIVERLALLDWFESLEIPKNLVTFENRIDIRDRYLAEGTLFDQRSANEGFLFLLFYFTLLISPDTPVFFAVDNIDTSLNPVLCAELMRQIVELAKKHDKQVILTTHNPATLDGLNLHDDEQRLLSVSRDLDGHTRARRVGPPKPPEGVTPVPLSEAFMRGFIGGLPKNF